MEALKGMDTVVTAESEDSQQQHQGTPEQRPKTTGKNVYGREERQFSGAEKSPNLKERISSGRVIKS